MKKYLNFSALAAIAVALTVNTSCSNDEVIEEKEAYIPEPVEFKVGVGKLETTRSVTTIDNDWDASTSLTIKVKVYTKDADDNMYNKTYVTSGSSAATTINETSMKYISMVGDGVTSDPSACFYWKSQADAKKIRAWTYGTATVPVTDLATNGTLNTLSFDLDGTGGTAQEGKELLYVYQKYTKSTDVGNATKSLVFKHQLAKVTINVYSQKNDAICTIGEDVGGHKIPVTNTFTQPANDTDDGGSASTYGNNGSWADFSDGTAAGYITPRRTTTNGTNSSELAVSADNTKYTIKNVYEAVLLPGDYGGKYLFVINYDGAKYAYIPEATHVLAIGNHYTYNIIVRDAALEVTAAIQPWNTSIQGDKDAVLQ